ncbi:MAG: helix-turn-helix domain-containing protein [Thermomicrobia bacterium]|nr:helix-turn-helix domain-containing protein [Thermomicrobia bacterium]
MLSPLTPAFLAIRDLCRRDSRLHVRLPAEVERATVSDATAVDVTYAMTMRPLPPFLRPLHGGELILMPRRIWPDVASYVGNLMAELGRNGVSAIVLEPDHPLASRDIEENIAVIVADVAVDAVLESHLNALIQTRGSDLYRLTTDLDRRLTGMSAHADALPALLATAAELSGRGLLLTDPAGLPIALAGSATPGYVDELARQSARTHGRTLIVQTQDGDGRLVTPVRTAEGVQGYLALTASRAGFTETDRLIAERTAYACSFSLMRAGPVAPAARQLGPTPAEIERSLRNLLLGKLETESAALAECRAIGLDPHRGAAVLLAAPLPDAESLGVIRATLENVVTSWQPRAFVMELGEVSAIAVLFPVTDGEASRRKAVEMGRRLADECGLSGIAVGISDRHVGWRGIAQGFQQAYFALRLGATAAVPQTVVDSGAAGDLGIYRLLYPLWQSDGLATFSDEVLGGLVAYDEKRGGGLVSTLEAYLDLGGGMQEIADRLYIHRNSLIYRLRRIEELTGRLLADPHDRLLLHLALKVRQMPDAPPIRAAR